MMSVPAFVCLFMIVYMPIATLQLLQANDERTKNRERFNIKIMHFSQEKAQLYNRESYKQKFLSSLDGET